MSAFAKNLDNLSPAEVDALLAQLLREKASSSEHKSPPSTIGHPAPPSSYPLSHGQQALWFLYQSAPESAAYNVGFAVRVRSHVDRVALRQAFQMLLDRHAALRTTFKHVPREQGTQEGGLLQVVHGEQAVFFEEVDAKGWSEQRLKEQVELAYKRPFDFEEGPLLRASLFTRSQHTHVLLLTIHHMAVDAWSVGLLLDELRQLYPAAKAGRKASLPSAAPYADFVAWQRDKLQAEGERLLAYWQEELAGAPQVLNLPTDYARPPVQTYKGASLTFQLPASLTAQIRDYARSEGATLYMTLLAAFQVLLHRYTGAESVLVGSPVAGREQREFTQTVGNFINSIVLRADFAGHPSFKEVLSQVRGRVLSALSHQAYPFALLVQHVQANRTASHSPLFQASFVLQKLSGSPLLELSAPTLTQQENGRESINWGGLDFAPYPIGQQEGQFDLTFEIAETKETLFAIVKYNSDLFNAETIRRMGGHFQSLLAGVVSHPETAIGKLPLLTRNERDKLLVTWNQTQSDYPRDKCMHQLFEAQAARTPEAIALLFGEQQLTYGELNCRANQLAHYLQEQGVGPEVLVGLNIERSIEMVVGLLGILKAGGAYVPLDPSFPQERLAFMIADSKVPILLTQEKLLGSIPYEGRQLALDSQWHLLQGSSERNPTSKVQPENLAYCIYTSGSTGKPKGVLLCHRSLTNFLTSISSAPGLTNQDTLLAVTTISFDIAGLELYLPLLKGAKLVLAEQEVISDGKNLLKKLISSGATVMQATPATWRMLLASGWQKSEAWQSRPAFLGQLKVLCGGEALPLELAHQLLALGVDLWNMYGPTETTIWSSLAHITDNQSDKDAHADASKGVITIGRPIANTQIYVLDEHLQPVPIGVPGELHIGGDGVARGYLNRPKLTNERFIRNPFGEGRLYKTGDSCRYLPDGKLEFLGRLDHQIKIRGFRVELGEIEAVLIGHELIREVVVVAQEEGGPSGTAQRLVAYFVPAVPASDLSPQTSDALTHRNLRLYLKDTLPDYMIPSFFVQLEALPLTPNGKVNRRGLPAPDDQVLMSKSYRAPRTESEKTLGTLWEEVLQRSPIGVDDNFFELGGHSLLVTQLLANVRQTFQVELLIRHLFERPTVAELAILIEAQKAAQEMTTLAIQPGQEVMAYSVPFGYSSGALLEEEEEEGVL